MREKGSRIEEVRYFKNGALWGLNNGINGGQMQDVTLGLNWFLNPNMKIQTNYVWADGNSPNSKVAGPFGLNGTAHGIGTRLAIDF